MFLFFFLFFFVCVHEFWSRLFFENFECGLWAQKLFFLNVWVKPIFCQNGFLLIFLYRQNPSFFSFSFTTPRNFCSLILLTIGIYFLQFFRPISYGILLISGQTKLPIDPIKGKVRKYYVKATSDD